MENYVKEFETQIESATIESQAAFDRAANKTLKRTIKRKIKKGEQEIEPIWFNSDIKKSNK